MARKGQKPSGSLGAKKQWHSLHSSMRKSSGFSEKNLIKQQTLTWKPINEKTYAFLQFTLEEAELKLFAESRDLIGDNEPEAIRILAQLKTRCVKKLKTAYYPEAKWQNVDMPSCIEWVEKMKEKNKLLQKALEEEERELEELDDEIQSIGE